MKIISWNIAHKREPWRCLLDMDSDVALLQEAAEPPPGVSQRIEVDPGPWNTAGGGGGLGWRAAVVKLSEKVSVDWIEAKPISKAVSGDFAVSQAGTLSAARVTPASGKPLIVISMYAPWTRPHASTKSRWIISDVSAHRLVSDLSAFIGRQRNHRIIAAGDLNILYGYGDHGSPYWKRRYQTVFDRMDAIGLPFAGPQAPNGRQASPRPKELPQESRNVPTFRTNRKEPKTATRQLDFVFVSESLAESVCVRALNEPGQWGPSDHCRLQIEISTGGFHEGNNRTWACPPAD